MTGLGAAWVRVNSPPVPSVLLLYFSSIHSAISCPSTTLWGGLWLRFDPRIGDLETEMLTPRLPNLHPFLLQNLLKLIFCSYSYWDIFRRIGKILESTCFSCAYKFLTTSEHRKLEPIEFLYYM